MRESEEIQTLKKVSSILQNEKIPYMLTGSVALSLYATPRMTRDIDMVVEVQASDIPKLEDAFKDRFFFQSEAAVKAVASRGIFNVLDLESMVKVDLIVKKDVPYQKEAFDRRKTLDVAGLQVSVITPEDLILSKLDWARESKMKDTSPIVEKKWRELVMEKSI